MGYNQTKKHFSTVKKMVRPRNNGERTSDYSKKVNIKKRNPQNQSQVKN